LKEKESGGRKLVRTALGLIFAGIGSLHFAMPEGFVKIVPPFLPEKLWLVYISGVFEILGGLGLLIPRTRKAAGWGLLVLLVAVFPANIYHALAKVEVGGLPSNPLYHLIRLPAQGLLIWLAGWSAGLFGKTKKGNLKSN
jgi:uncharacterized membrane protein